jgi:hypothetical protein
MEKMNWLMSVMRPLNEVAAATGGRYAVSSLVRLSERGRKSLAEQVEREIGSPEIVVRFFHEHLYLEGVAESDFEADRAVELARSTLSRGMSAWGAASPRKPGSIGGSDSPGAPQAGVKPESAASSPIPHYLIVDLMRIRPRPASAASAGKR